MSGARVAFTEPPPDRGDHAPPLSFIALELRQVTSPPRVGRAVDASRRAERPGPARAAGDGAMG
jgi:hypothetical protein